MKLISDKKIKWSRVNRRQETGDRRQETGEMGMSEEIGARIVNLGFFCPTMRLKYAPF
ncbi:MULTISPECIES: hypothetical protein [Okeania]|uniref:hypothetical protein n=1 Tax=Okeania TaxID=1458928 RepID=UPI001374EB2D|nr:MULTISPECIES: hypothetical protein [Okeania]NET76241.1 hypothetical protein [Okeania sp. SIO1F9]